MSHTKDIDQVSNFLSSVKTRIEKLNDDIQDFVTQKIDGDLILYYPFDRFSSCLLLLQELENIEQRLSALRTSGISGDILSHTLVDINNKIEFIDSEFVVLNNCFNSRKNNKSLQEKLAVIEFYFHEIVKGTFEWNGIIALGECQLASPLSQIIMITPNYIENVEFMPITGHEMGHIIMGNVIEPTLKEVFKDVIPSTYSKWGKDLGLLPSTLESWLNELLADWFATLSFMHVYARCCSIELEPTLNSLIRNIDREMALLKRTKKEVDESDCPNDMTIFLQRVRSHPFSDLRMLFIWKTLEKMKIDTKGLRKDWKERSKLVYPVNIPMKKAEFEKEMTEMEGLLSSFSEYIVSQIFGKIDAHMTTKRHSNFMLKMFDDCWQSDQKAAKRTEILASMTQFFRTGAKKIEPVFL